MVDDAYERRFHQHEELLRSLTAMLVAQHEMNQRVAEGIQEQREFNALQLEINQRLEITQARIETLLARMIRPTDNGRDA